MHLNLFYKENNKICSMSVAAIKRSPGREKNNMYENNSTRT